MCYNIHTIMEGAGLERSVFHRFTHKFEFELTTLGTWRYVLQILEFISLYWVYESTWIDDHPLLWLSNSTFYHGIGSLSCMTGPIPQDLSQKKSRLFIFCHWEHELNGSGKEFLHLSHSRMAIDRLPWHHDVRAPKSSTKRLQTTTWAHHLGYV